MFIVRKAVLYGLFARFSRVLLAARAAVFLANRGRLESGNDITAGCGLFC